MNISPQLYYPFISNLVLDSVKNLSNNQEVEEITLSVIISDLLTTNQPNFSTEFDKTDQKRVKNGLKTRVRHALRNWEITKHIELTTKTAVKIPNFQYKIYQPTKKCF